MTRASLTAASTPNAIDVDDREADQHELIKTSFMFQLMQQANDGRYCRWDISCTQTPHEECVDGLHASLRPLMLQIPADPWLNFSIAVLELIKDFTNLSSRWYTWDTYRWYHNRCL